MKISFFPISFLLGLSFFIGNVSAESLEHFATNDGRHFCSVFMKSEFKPCEEFGVVYEGDRVVTGSEPGFSAGFPSIEKVTIGSEEFCVEGSLDAPGHEVDMEKCNSASENTTVQEYEENGVKVRIKMGNTSLSDSEDTGITTSDSLQNSSSSSENSGITDESLTPSESEDISGTGESFTPSERAIAVPVSHTEKPQFTPIKEIKGSCKVNGQEVDCEQVANEVKAVAKAGLGILGMVLIFGFIFSIFWIWMLAHALMNPIPNKTLWILAIFFLSPFGAIIYFFAVKKNFQPQNSYNQYPQTTHLPPTQVNPTPGVTQVPTEMNTMPIITPVVAPSIQTSTYLSESNLGVQSSFQSGSVSPETTSTGLHDSQTSAGDISSSTPGNTTENQG